MLFWNRSSDFHLNHNGAQPLLTHDRAFYLDTIHPVTRNYVTPTRLFPVVRHQAKTAAEMRQEIEDAWQEAYVRSEERARERERERERRSKLQTQNSRDPKVVAQRRREEARQRMEQERLEAEKLKDGRVFSEIVSLLQGYTINQISADSKLREYFIQKLPGLLNKNAQRLSMLEQMLSERACSMEGGNFSL